MRAAFVVAMLAWNGAVLADASGENVYQEVCVACHSTKFDKAPQLGDRKAWAPLLTQNQATLTAHAWVGVRNMPPRGGKIDLELRDFARAVAYMARQAGGNWRDPDEAMLQRIGAEEKKHLEHGHGKH